MSHCPTCQCVHEDVPVVDNSLKALSAFRSMVPSDEMREHFCVLYLGARHGIRDKRVISIGTLTASLVHPREIYARAIELRAAGIIIGHNHPSGDSDPSPEDKTATRRVQQAGDILGIKLLDHIIFTPSSYFSFRERGIL